MEPAGQPVIGWLRSAETPTQAWPGVLLAVDAFLVRAPRGVLTKPPADLQLVIEGEGGFGPRVHVDAVTIAEGGVRGADPAAAMLRLTTDTGMSVPVGVDREQIEFAIAETGDLWTAAETLGLVPEGLAGRVPPERLLAVPFTPPVQLASIGYADGWFCTVFWWLC